MGLRRSVMAPVVIDSVKVSANTAWDAKANTIIKQAANLAISKLQQKISRYPKAEIIT
jgi:hypothetical protein